MKLNDKAENTHRRGKYHYIYLGTAGLPQKWKNLGLTLFFCLFIVDIEQKLKVKKHKDIESYFSV